MDAHENARRERQARRERDQRIREALRKEGRRPHKGSRKLRMPPETVEWADWDHAERKAG